MISGTDVRRRENFDIARLFLSVVFFASILQATKICSADDGSGGDSLPGWTAAKDAELDRFRGGFMLDNGMVVDLSFATSVFINGQEQFSDRFALANDVSIDQLRGAVVNNGSGSLAMSDAGPGNLAVIQNTMDNQLITMVRSIDIVLSNIKGMDMSGLGSSVRGFAP